MAIDTEKLAARIVDDFIPLCIATGSGVTNENIAFLLDVKQKERDEAILRVRSLIADALTADED